MTTSGYSDRILLVEVKGLCQSDHPGNHYTLKVPYPSLTRTLQFINRSGGKIVRVASQTLSLPDERPFQYLSDSQVVVEESPVSTSAGVLQSSTQGDAAVESVPAPSADSDSDSEKPLSLDAKIEISESTQGLSKSETEDLPASSPVDSEISAPPRLPDLIRFLLKKLAGSADSP